MYIAAAAAAAKSNSVVSDSVWSHRQQPTRLPRSWDSPGKNTGVGCHFLLQCMKVKSESEVAQSCPAVHDRMDYSLPGSSVHGIFQARVLEWGAITFSEYAYYQMWNRSLVQVRCMRQGAQCRCTGRTLRDGMQREVGGGFRMGNTYTPMADSCECMAKTTTIL